MRGRGGGGIPFPCPTPLKSLILGLEKGDDMVLKDTGQFSISGCEKGT